MQIRTRLLGLLLILLGAWAGIVAYVGPLFGYRMTGGPAWAWTTSHWELHAAPGAAVVVGGLLVVAAAPRMIARAGAALAVAAGTWVVVGPLFASMWLGGDSESQLASATLHQVARPLGYHYGTGVLIVAVAAYAWAACTRYARTEPYPRTRETPVTDEDQLTSIMGRRADGDYREA
jgi:hypothetical protein